MAPFDPDAPLGLDYRLMRDGCVTLFHRREDLAETVSWLTANGYRVVTLDAAAWHSRADFHRDVKAALGFPDYYGNNLDAFNDSFADLTRRSGIVLACTGYDAFAAREPTAAQSILDIVATQARAAMLFGNRVLCLIQSDDRGLAFAPVGAVPITWF